MNDKTVKNWINYSKVMKNKKVLFNNAKKLNLFWS